MMPTARGRVVDDGQRHVEQRHADGRAGSGGTPDPAGQRGAHLGRPAYFLDPGQVLDRHLGIAQYAAVDGDHADARAVGRAPRAQGERAHVVRRRALHDEREGLS